MKTSEFDFYLPPELIAQQPLLQRDCCRLMVVYRDSGKIEHRIFKELPTILNKGDRLILNDTKVIPARLFCRKDTGARVEIFFLESIDNFSFKALVKPAKRLRPGIVIGLEKNPQIRLKIDDKLEDGSWIVKVTSESSCNNIEEILNQFGCVPLPHYINRNDEKIDAIYYQTVFAARSGAVASPTAGLHFTEELIDNLKQAGIAISFVTLHIGIGTFKPVKVDDPSKHVMHSEYYEIGQQTATQIMQTRCANGRNIAVGTTVVRVLEHCAANGAVINESRGNTNLLILPGYTFKITDGLITNFHLPKSTLLMLVCAFASKELIFNAYEEAVKLGYRFYSYGDAMIIL